jgi:hypothetical protein
VIGTENAIDVCGSSYVEPLNLEPLNGCCS